MADVRMKLSEKVARARLAEYRARVPVLYALLIFNTAFLSASDAAEGSRLVAIALTGVFTLIAIIRLRQWRRMPVALLTRAQVDAELRRARTMVFILGMGGLAFAIWLYPGVTGPSEPVNAFVALTIASVVYLLTPVPETAYLAVCFILGPYCAAMLMRGDADQRFLALNFAALGGVLFFAVRVYAREFMRAVIDSHRARRRANFAHDLYRRNELLARTDALTGLPNRRSFFDRLGGLVDEVGARPFALGVLDLDTFKSVNDMYGHIVGDELLKGVAEKLSAAREEGVWACRLGGDEFGLLFSGFADDADLARRAGRVLAALREFSCPSRPDVRAHASLGLAVFGRETRSAGDLYEYADRALYSAKENCRGAAVIYTDDLDASLRRRQAIEKRLREPGFFERLDVAFQPIVDTRAGTVVCMEALSRWRDPELGVVPPDEFVPICEQNGLISRLTVAVMRRAFAEARNWDEPANVAINLSAQDLASDAAALAIVAAVQDAGLPARRITFEITETTLIADFDKAARALDMLKRLGARIALDDFGNGYSALRYIRALPLDEVKIDRSLAEDIVDDARARKLLESIMALCANLGIAVVIEGVETARQVETLRAIGCARMQGWFFTKPLTPDRAAAMLAHAPAVAKSA